MRTKAFDMDQVLDKAVRIFWLKGYEPTTITALEVQMGIKRQSLYNTFDNKHSLFLSSLKYYHDHIIVENFGIYGHVFYKAIMRAQDLGEVDSSKNAELIAMQLLNNAQGLFVLSKSGTSRKKLNTLVEQFLTILD
jgi:AcrR family transcriptional regulator